MADSDDITDLVQEFMAVTGAEDVTAMRYLQQSNWNVEVSVLYSTTFFQVLHSLVNSKLSFKQRNNIHILSSTDQTQFSKHTKFQKNRLQALKNV